MSTATIPKMEPVKSSNVEAVGYDPESHELHVKFKGGDHYVYHDIAAGIHAKLIASDSVGGYLHKHIKGVFKHRKL